MKKQWAAKEPRWRGQDIITNLHIYQKKLQWVVLHALHKHFNLFLYNFTATHPMHDPKATYKTLVLATVGRAWNQENLDVTP